MVRSLFNYICKLYINSCYVIICRDSALLCTELGFLFHQIDCLASHGMVYPKPPGEKQDPCRNVVGAFVPTNFLSTFMTMPEASALALLDGNPTAGSIERRPEAFYRFLLHHLDKELNTASIPKRRMSLRKPKSERKRNLIDALYGMDAVSMNEFEIEGANSESMTVTRSNTVDLVYDAFVDTSEEKSLPQFGELLRFSLCKEVPQSAWYNATQSFETVVQRKIITSLPTIMSLSCDCAGANSQDRLKLWRKSEDTFEHWLPEQIEVEIEDNGNVVTRQFRGKEWEEFCGEGLPSNITTKIKEATTELDEGQRRARYQLQAIVTFVNNNGGSGSNYERGHHVLHLRVSKAYKKQILLNQLRVTKEHFDSIANAFEMHLTLTRDVTSEDLESRIHTIEEKLKQLHNDENSHEWVLFNGPNVSSTVVEDALAFHVSFKEPCIIIYRQIDKSIDTENTTVPKIDIPKAVMTSPLQIGKI